MDNPLLDPQEVERRLMRLTRRQCQILYWLSQDLLLKEVGRKVNCHYKTLEAEMTRIFKAFGLRGDDTKYKQHCLRTYVLPVVRKIVRDPSKDCANRLVVIEQPEPTPEEVEEVRKDLRRGLFPLDGQLITVLEPEEIWDEDEEEGNQEPKYLPAPRPSCSAWMLVLILSMLLAVALFVIVVLLVRQPDGMLQSPTPDLQSQVALQQTTPTTAIATVLVTQPPITVLVTQPPPTTATTQPAVRPTQAPVTQPIPSPQPNAQGFPCTPSAGTVNLVGKAVSEIPGTPLCVGTTASSVIDRNTKPRDVYAINLAAGQEYRFTVETRSGCLYLNLFNLGSKSIETGKVSRAFYDSTCSKANDDFTPAVSGTYYVEVGANDTGVNYTLIAKPTSASVPGNQIANDIPGTKLTVGGTRSSAIDRNTKPRDVYAVDLSAGQGVRFTVTTHTGCAYVNLFNPNSKSIETNQTSRAFYDSTCSKAVDDFTPAVAGTYYFEVGASDSGVTYTVGVISLK